MAGTGQECIPQRGGRLPGTLGTAEAPGCLFGMTSSSLGPMCTSRSWGVPTPRAPSLLLPRLPGPNRMEALIGSSTATGHGGQGRRPGAAGPKPAGRCLLPAQAPALPGAPAHQSAVGPGTGPPPLCSRTLEVNQRLGRPRLQCTVVRKVLLAHLGKTMAVLWKCRARGRGSRVSWLR